MDTTTEGGRTTRPSAHEDRTPALATVARAHVRRPTVWLLALFTLVAVAARLGVGGWSRGDVVLAVVQVATFPLLEWVLHTALLHWRPRRLGRLTLDPQVARKHREHHADPREL
ncbi:MAG: fatty acid hydroxylase family protein, partial [Proteobacteria bacterium]|nr:fatty acid hydroxylase family protein [Pseudomonadota bacterium]